MKLACVHICACAYARVRACVHNQKKFLTKKNFFDQKFFFTKNSPKKFFDQKNFFSPNFFFYTKHFFYQKNKKKTSSVLKHWSHRKSRVTRLFRVQNQWYPSLLESKKTRVEYPSTRVRLENRLISDIHPPS